MSRASNEAVVGNLDDEGDDEAIATVVALDGSEPVCVGVSEVV